MGPESALKVLRSIWMALDILRFNHLEKNFFCDFLTVTLQISEIRSVFPLRTRPALDRFHDSSKVNALVCFMLYALCSMPTHAHTCPSPLQKFLLLTIFFRQLFLALLTIFLRRLFGRLCWQFFVAAF